MPSSLAANGSASGSAPPAVSLGCHRERRGMKRIFRQALQVSISLSDWVRGWISAPHDASCVCQALPRRWPVKAVQPEIRERFYCSSDELALVLRLRGVSTGKAWPKRVFVSVELDIGLGVEQFTGQVAVMRARHHQRHAAAWLHAGSQKCFWYSLTTPGRWGGGA